MRTTLVPYRDEGVELEAFVACPEKEKRPVVLLCHAWNGRDEFICEKARAMAERGYVGFALDMYGKGVLGRSREESIFLKQPFLDDRRALLKRVSRGLEAACSWGDAKRVAAIGFGFGGICALDLARSGASLKGAVSVYGHFDPPPFSSGRPIRAKVLVLHGYGDPIAPQSELRRFEKEMEDAKVDWQAHIYGGAMHGFAAPEANAPKAGILYHPMAAARAWAAMEQFLNEVFAP